MATLSITNISSDPVYLADLYYSLQPGASTTVERAYPQFLCMPDLLYLMRIGSITVTITPTADELAKAYLGYTLADHNTIQGIQGGGVTERYHLTQAQHSALGSIPNHNDTGSIQGGGATERYHLTQAQHTTLTNYNHNDLNNFQGGNVTERYHLTQAQHSALGSIPNHNDTGSIQGGGATERYHLTLAQHTSLTSMAGNTVYDIGTLAALAALPVTSLPDHMTLWCSDVQDFYVLYKTPTGYTPDGLAVIAGMSSSVWVAHLFNRWRDITGDVSQGVGTSGLTYEAFRDTAHFDYFMIYDQNDALSMRFQMQHDWNLQAVRLHIHTIPMADPVSTQVVKISAYYTWIDPGQVVPALSGWTTIPTISVNINPGDVYKQKIIDLGTIAVGANPQPSSILLAYISRPGLSDPLDTYHTSKSPGTAKANLCIMYSDAHYKLARVGSINEYQLP